MKDTRGYRRAVRVIVEREGKILLGKRHLEKDNKTIFLFPGGGIEDGESVEETAVKEAKEEVGLAVDNVRAIDYENKYDKVHDKPERAKLYRGSHDIWVCATYSGKDTSQLGSQGDAFKYAWMDLADVIKVYQSLPQDLSTKGNLKGLNAYSAFLKKASLESYKDAQRIPACALPIW